MALTLAKTKQSETAAQQRQDHELAAQALFIEARHCAEDGRINEAGSLILQALEHERRAGCAGPRFSSSSSLVLDERLKFVQAGDRTRTGDVQLGKLTFYH